MIFFLLDNCIIKKSFTVAILAQERLTYSTLVFHFSIAFSNGHDDRGSKQDQTKGSGESTT
jgi:hypothetical protein